MLSLLRRPSSITEAEQMIAALILRPNGVDRSELVIRHVVERQSVRQIARDLGMDRETVRREVCSVRRACSIANASIRTPINSSKGTPLR
jgi:DNA-directed RNA polymerase specialized sigma24 family protein